MPPRHYSDFFYVPDNYRSVMTREAINETPDTWMDFYPHAKFTEFLLTFFFDETRSVWLYGNFGTGKSNAALVTQKLFMDDAQRVNAWFDKHHDEIPNCERVREQLMKAREKGTFVVYDYNASGLNPDKEFLVRLEKTIQDALRDAGLKVPANANRDEVIARLRREGAHFFETRDSMQGELSYLTSDIRTTEKLIALLSEEASPREKTDSMMPTHYLEDTLTVFRRDNIYLSVDVKTFRAWIAAICKENHLSRIIYLFDEFSDFIDLNGGRMKTFEDVTENPDVNRFYLVPVTHKELRAYLGEKSQEVSRANERFYFRDLQMPNDIAFKLAKSAMREADDDEMRKEWAKEKETLWLAVRDVADKFTDPPESEAYVSHDSFWNILPIHPMAGFLLKFLAESARSNQRSIFEFLKGSADGREFQDFIKAGGPAIPAKQFLTVDYLWKYFMEHEELGQNPEISNMRMEYKRIHAREFSNYQGDEGEIRVLKTVLLFCLLSRLMTTQHDRLRPTVENVCLSFRGDGTISDPKQLLHILQEKHCFAIVDGNLDLYASTVGGEELNAKTEELKGKFQEVAEKLLERIDRERKESYSGGLSVGRFSVKVSDASNVNMTSLSTQDREPFSANLEKDDGSCCLWFAVAKNQEQQRQIPQRAESLLTNLRGHRVIICSFPAVTFCEDNVQRWDDYVSLWAQCELENSKPAKDHYQKSMDKIEKKWWGALAQTSEIDMRYYDNQQGAVLCERVSWPKLKEALREYVRRNLPCCPDSLTTQLTAYGTSGGLKSWAMAGIRFASSARYEAQLIANLKAKGIREEQDWLAHHPEHPFGQIHALFQKEYARTVEQGGKLSLRKVATVLQRAPYGLRCNGLSAFSMGFCLRDTLSRNCQWTNGQIMKPLDEGTLAEIIDSAISPSKKQNDQEKFICQLSKEHLAFAGQAGRIFFLSASSEPTPESTIDQIAKAIEKISHKVPLWALAEFIRHTAPEEQTLYEVLNRLCVALRTSSKGNTEDRAAAVYFVGDAILQDENLVARGSAYMKTDIFISAFRWYVNQSDPNLHALAEEIGDVSCQYCERILEKAAKTSGWLYNRQDISGFIAEVYTAYQFIQLAKDIFRFDGYATFAKVLQKMRDRFRFACLPYALITDKYPALSQFYQLIENPTQEKPLYDELRSNSDILRKLYGERESDAVIEIIRKETGESRMSNEDLRDIILKCGNSKQFDVHMDLTAYRDLFRKVMEESERESTARKMLEEWKRISSSTTPANWAEETGLPGWTVIAEVSERNDILKSFFYPENSSTQALKQNLETLRTLSPVSIPDCQKAFLQKIVPSKYAKLGINLPHLLSYLTKEYGSNPNGWPENPDIDAFVRSCYECEFAPRIVRRLMETDAEHLKAKLIELAKRNPDIGLHFLE